MFFDFRGSSGNGRYPALFLNGDNTLTYWYDSGTRITSNAINLNAWNHIALTRSGTDVKLFINGQQEGSTFTDSSTQLIGTNAPIFGNDTSASFGVIGYMSDIRILNGTAAYTSNFTPPTQPLTAITNTKFLLGRLPYFKDQSTSNHAITVGGDASLRPFSSFDNAAYSEASHGASVYFDGTGDYLTCSRNSGADYQFGSGNFTAEGYFYVLGTANLIVQSAVIDLSLSGASSNSSFFLNINHNQVTGYFSDGSGWDQSTTISTSSNIGQWVHVAWVRNGSTLTIYRNGVSIGTITSFITLGDSTLDLSIGTQNSSGVAKWQGYMSDIRLVKGTAVYTSNFTPPTAPLTTSPTYSALAIGVANSGASSYTLSGDVTGSNATVNMAIGQTVNFTVNASGHPFYIRVSDGGANVQYSGSNRTRSNKRCS